MNETTRFFRHIPITIYGYLTGNCGLMISFWVNYGSNNDAYVYIYILYYFMLVTDQFRCISAEYGHVFLHRLRVIWVVTDYNDYRATMGRTCLNGL